MRFCSRSVAALAFALRLTGGAVSASAQDVPRGVVIHERVEIPAPDPLEASAQASRKAVTTATGAAAVGEVIFRPSDFSDVRGRTRFGGTGGLAALPDAARLRVTTTLGTTYETGLGDGFEVASDQSLTCDGQEYARADFTPLDSVAVLRVPLAFNEFVSDIELSPTPERDPGTRGESFVGQMGCWYALGRDRCDCYDGQSGALREAAFAISRETEGHAVRVVATGVSAVTCGQTGRVDVRLVREDGQEGYVAPLETVRLKVRGTGPGTLRYGDVVGREIVVPYAEARQAGVTYVAPACDGQVGDLETVIDVYSGNRGNGVVPITVKPEGDDGPDPPEPPACKSGDDCPEPPETLPPVLRLLDQSDRELSLTAEDGGYVRMSKVRPDWLLPPLHREPFDTRFGTLKFPNDLEDADSRLYHDPDTYRVEVKFVPDDIVVSDRLRDLELEIAVVSPNGDTETTQWLSRNDATGDAKSSEPLVETRLGTARWKRYFRIVSNEQDDRVEGEQTIRAGLGDQIRVRVMAPADGTEPAVSLGKASYWVGAPPEATSPDAIRYGHLAWRVWDGIASGSVDPALATERASENWAQAGITFIHTVTRFDFRTASNVLPIQFSHGGKEARATGTVSVDIDTPQGLCRVRDALFAAGRTLNQVAASIATRASLQCPYFNQQGGVVPATAAWDVSSQPQVRNGSPGRLDRATGYYVVFGRAGEVAVRPGSLRSSTSEVVERVPDRGRERDPSRTPNRSEMVIAIAMAHADSDETTIDAFAVPRRAIQSYRRDETAAFAFGAGGKLMNVLVARPSAVGTGSDRLVVGHELGHVLLNGQFVGSGDTGTGNHSPVDYHLMFFKQSDETSGSRGTRRLTEPQALAARCESGPSADVAGQTCPSTDPTNARPPLLTRDPRP